MILAEEGTTNPNGVAEDDVTTHPNVVAEEFTTGIDEDYVASEGSSFQNKKDQAEMVHDESEDSDHLYTPLRSDDENDRMRYPTCKSGQGMEFQIGMMFTNKEMIRDVVKDHAMEN
ncbi:hypothetical protein KIW84_040918 [Lathyrus oleraceus]|uniref:Uncharacterized protein n=1 Tax=Pisum sativum TaxID=3888 RepID=A0A9D4X8D9_PEA|nr:hypothetical protein KIW84_040918 [Pisum sativum]